MKIALVNEACPYMDVKDTTPKEIFPSFCPVMHEGGESRVPLTFFSSFFCLKPSRITKFELYIMYIYSS